jgi:hypothetical protein
MPIELVAIQRQPSLNCLPYELNRFSVQIAAITKREVQILFCSFMSSK